MSEISSVVSKAAATISRDIFFRSLRVLCVRKIALSLKFYRDNGVTSLVPKLCEEIFESYLEHVNHEKLDFFGRQDDDAILYTKLSNFQLLEIASLFVHSGLKCFKSEVVRHPELRSDLEEGSHFFKKLAIGAPKLASFDYQFYNYNIENPMLPSKYINFGQMSQLITLKLNFEPGLPNDDLKVIGTSLPLLRRLEISLKKDVTIERGLEHLQQLKMLENLVLTFCDMFIADTERGCSENGIIEFCLFNMPTLKISGYELDNREYGDPMEMLQSHTFSIFKKTKDSPVELGLQHVKLCEDFPPANVSLPHVTHLRVLSAEAVEFCLGRTFPKLKKFYVYNVPFIDFVKLLQHFGHSLTKLSLTTVMGVCDILEILNLCPHLEHFIIENSYVDDMGVVNPSVSRLLTKMKTFCYWSPEHTNVPSYCKATGLLKMLMTSCPNLEFLSLEVNIPQAEVDEVAAGIASGAYLCIPKLKIVSITIIPIIAQESMDNFMMQLTANCPKLTSIDVKNVCINKLGPLLAMMNKFDRGHVMKLPN